MAEGLVELEEGLVLQAQAFWMPDDDFELRCYVHLHPATLHNDDAANKDDHNHGTRSRGHDDDYNQCTCHDDEYGRGGSGYIRLPGAGFFAGELVRTEEGLVLPAEGSGMPDHDHSQ